jgi:cobalt/nickel transport protein
MNRSTKLVVAGLTISLLVAFFLSPLASSLPDGLEKVIQKLVPAGHVSESESSPPAPLPDYGLPGLKNERLSTGLAGVIGTLLVFAAVFFLGKLLARKKSSSSPGRRID